MFIIADLMNNYLNKILKFSLIILILIVFAQLFAFFDQKNEAKNQIGFAIFKTKFALAQFFFPRYPERLKYVVGELNQASEQLVYYNEELEKLTDQCSCKNTTSQCGGQSAMNVPSKKNIELNPAVFTALISDPGVALEQAENEIARVKEQVINSITNLEIYIEVSKPEQASLEDKIKNIFTVVKKISLGVQTEEIGKEYKEELEKARVLVQAAKPTYETETKKELEKTKTDIILYPSEIKELENQLQEFKKINNSLDEEKKQLEQLKKESEETPGKPLNYYQDMLSGMENRLKEKINAVQELPNQLKEKLAGIVLDLQQQIANLPDSLKNLLRPIKCEKISPEAFGEPCAQRKKIEKNQIEIQNKIDQISFLRELLQKEMESGLKAELETLREDEATQLENNLNEILVFSQNIITPAKANIEALNDSQYSVGKQCQANCEQGISYKIQACANPGEQKPIELIFEVGASLKELKLGEIVINELGLNLPEKIKIGDIASIKDFKIPLPDELTLNIPPTPAKKWQDLSLPPIVFHPSLPEIPTFPWAEFSCPQFSSKPYQCLGEEEKSANAYIDLEWYLQTFSWFSEKCQEIPGLKDQYGMPSQECFDKDNVHLTIIRQCDTLWQEYFGCIDTPFSECQPPSGICGSILSSSQRAQAQQRECQNLYKELGETTPQTCNLAALETKCSQLKKTMEREIPESCEFLPLFTKKFKEPEPQQYQGQASSCPSQTIPDNPGMGARLDCPFSIADLLSNIPKIKLRDIIIPDIRLPSFSFPPFLKVKLPNFIFEDLIFPELSLCNLDDCKRLIPPLELAIPFPILKIPPIEETISVKVPAIPGLPSPKTPFQIEIDKIDFPPIPIPLPDIDLTKLISLDLELPEIPLPLPEILLNFKGLKIDVMNLLLGLVSRIIPIPSGCIAAGIDFIPLVIAYPDYYFYWPKFPEIPDLCNNKHISINKFCQDVKEKLDSYEVVEKINEVQKILNEAIEKNIQSRLDEISVAYEEIIKEQITKRLEEIKTRIEEELEKQIQKALGKGGEELEVDPVKIPLEDIDVPMEKINLLLAKIPKEIPIPWPETLKEIKLKEPIKYQLPSIPLDNLSYKKEIPLKIPGFQYPSLQFSLNFLSNHPSCGGKTPSGGNPYPMDRINVNLGEIFNLNQEINQTRESINEVLR